MNTNYETVVSLIELLVKKAGFDLSSNYSEIELQKTKDSISSLVKERNTSNDKKTINALIENLKVRQANWENNAEMVGKSLLKAYEEGKDYSTVKMRIELLGNLAQKGTDNISVGGVYDRLRSLDSDYKSLLNKIENTDYTNVSEKEMDTRYKTYLENKITSIEIEVEALDKELESLREVELKDVGIVTKMKEYITKLNSDREKIDKAVSSSINSDIAFDVWERLETAKNKTEEKLDHANDILSKTEETLENVRKNRTSINERKNNLDAEKTRCNTKLNNINAKLEENSYENTTERMIDVNSSEMMKLELEALKNKKDVVYVDVGKVKEELIKAWSRERPPMKKPKEIVEEPPVIPEENIEPESEIEEILNDIEKEPEINTDTKETVEEIKEEVTLEKEEEPFIKRNKEKVNLNADEHEVGKALDNIDELIEKSEKRQEKQEELQIEPKVEEKVEPKVEVKEKKNKIELDW